MPHTLIVVPRKPMRSKITKPGKSSPGKLWNISQQAFEQTGQVHRGAVNEHGIAIFGHEDIAALAYTLWQGRGGPDGSPEEDWFHAAQELRARREVLQK